MDTFMEKLMQQQRTAQGMIEANSAADAAKMEMLQRQMSGYEMILQEMRKINLKTVENTEEMRKINLKTVENTEHIQKVIQAGIQKIESFQADNNAQAATEEVLMDMKKQLEDSFHKECIKVYRNVQASMMDEMDKQAAAIAAKQQENGKKQKLLMPVAFITMLLVAVDILVHLFNIVIPL